MENTYTRDDFTKVIIKYIITGDSKIYQLNPL